MMYRDVLLKIAPMSDLSDQRYEIVCLGAETEEELEKLIQSAKKWRRKKWPFDGEEVPCQIIYLVDGKLGEFDYFWNKKVGDFIKLMRYSPNGRVNEIR